MHYESIHFNRGIQPHAIKRNDVVKHMGVMPVEDRQVGAYGEIVYAATQIFFKGWENNIPGQVNRHTEDADVSEIYFPLVNTFNVTRGDEKLELKGDLSLSDIRGSQYTVLYDTTSNSFFLDLASENVHHTPIPGFIIPGGTLHSTEQIHDSVTAFFAIKVKAPSVKS